MGGLRIWTKELDDKLIGLYPDTHNKEISKIMNLSVKAITNRAYVLGVKKSESYMRELSRTNYNKNENLKNACFKKGHLPYNKGLKREVFLSEDSIRNIEKYHFKKGYIPSCTKPNGYERVSSRGFIEVKVGYRKFVLKHRKVWEESYGKIPEKHMVVFRDGNKLNCSLENLELISFDENLIRNKFVPNCSRDVQSLDYCRQLLKRKIKALSSVR